MSEICPLQPVLLQAEQPQISQPFLQRGRLLQSLSHHGGPSSDVVFHSSTSPVCWGARSWARYPEVALRVLRRGGESLHSACWQRSSLQPGTPLAFSVARERCWLLLSSLPQGHPGPALQSCFLRRLYPPSRGWCLGWCFPRWPCFSPLLYFLQVEMPYN